MKAADFNILQSYILLDRDISDKDEFMSHLFREVEKGEVYQQVEVEDPAIQTAIHKALQRFETNGPARKRPGMSVKVVNQSERLRNDPGERNEFEVARTDAIPFATYKRMSRDPVIQLSELMLRGWIAGLKFSVSAPNEEIEALTKRAMSKVYSQLVRDLMLAVRYGFTFGEKVWKREQITIDKQGPGGTVETAFSGEAVTLRKIKFIDPEQNIRFFKGKDDEIKRIEQQQAGGQIKVNREKLVWFALDQEFSGVFGRSRYKNMYDDWYYFSLNKQQMLRHVERTGSPALEARYPEGVGTLDGEDVQNVEIAAQLAQMLLNQGIKVLPSSRDENGEYLWDLHFDESGDSDTEPFVRVGEVLQRRMSEGLGVPPALSVGDTNFNEADAKAEMLLVIVEDLVDQIERVIQTDVVNQIVEYNFGPEAVDGVVFKIERSGLGRRKMFQTIYINMLRTLMSRKDMLPTDFPDLRAVGEELGLPTTALVDQIQRIQSEDPGPDGESPAVKAQQDDDANDPDRNRLNPAEREAKEKTVQDPEVGRE